MTRRMRDSLTLMSVPVVACLAWLAIPGPAQGQFRQYMRPGTVVDRPGDDRQRLEQQMERALWKLGVFRLDPWLGITNVSVVTNAFSTPTGQEQDLDLTMTLGAGVRGIVPFGAKTFFTFEAIPQYVFWLDQDDRNQFNHWYGARLYGFYNRLYIETGASRRDQVGIRTSEADVLANTRRDIADLLAELRLGGSVHLFGSTSYAEIRNLEEETDERLPIFSQFDRDETIHRGGFRYKPQPGSFIGIGVEWSEAEFLDLERDRSNSGTSPLLQFQHDAPRFFLVGEIVFRDLEPEGDTSRFVPFDGVTGNLQITFNPGWRMSYTPYYRRSLTYALDELYSYFENDRYGLQVGAKLSDRWTGSLYGEGGTDDFVAITEMAPRADDFTSVGIDFAFQISRRFALAFGYSVDEWDSNLSEFDRDNGRFRLYLNTSDLMLGRR